MGSGKVLDERDLRLFSIRESKGVFLDTRIRDLP